jgi:hypothetical protein
MLHLYIIWNIFVELWSAGKPKPKPKKKKKKPIPSLIGQFMLISFVLQMWWSKMSHRLRNLTLVRTIRVPSTTKRDSFSSTDSNNQDAVLLTSHLNVNESCKSRILQRTSLSSDSDYHSTTRSLATGIYYKQRIVIADSSKYLYL